MRYTTLGRAGPRVSRLGLGLAAIGRPAYITSGRDHDLPADRSVPSMQARAVELLEAAVAAGIRYVDVARSYGRAEDFLGSWLATGRAPADLVVGSKWGYRYVGDWRVDADVHEVKEHSLAAFRRQYRETRARLGDRLHLYQVHSATLDSGALSDPALHRRLAALREEGVLVGLSTSGPDQAAAIRAALDIQVDGARVFSCVQATWNLLEPSAGAALTEAADAGWGVLVKEVLANGRLAADGDGGRRLLPAATAAGSTPSALSVAAALSQPWASLALSGAVTLSQLADHVTAVAVALPPPTDLPDLAEPPASYWAARAVRPWR